MAASFIRIFCVIVLVSSLAVASSIIGLEPLPGGAARWPTREIKLLVSSSLFENATNIKAGTDVAAVLARATARWEAVSDIEIQVSYSGLTSVNTGAKKGDGISLLTIDPSTENLLFFTNQQAKSAGATRVFFNDNREIVEADIALNPLYLFSDDGTPGTFDLESVLTHEIGHFLGIQHSMVSSSRMYHEIQMNRAGLIQDRNPPLSRDDIARVRGLYGASLETDNCCSTLSWNLGAATPAGHVVAIDRSTGAVAGASARYENGRYEISGLSSGNYGIWFVRNQRPDVVFSDLMLADVRIGSRDTKAFDIKKEPSSINFDLQQIGTDISLSKEAVKLERGRMAFILVSGLGLTKAGIKIGTSSGAIVVLSVRDASSEFSGPSSVVRLELEVAEAIAAGNYSIYAEDERGLRKYLFGVLTVR